MPYAWRISSHSQYEWSESLSSWWTSCDSKRDCKCETRFLIRDISEHAGPHDSTDRTTNVPPTAPALCSAISTDQVLRSKKQQTTFFLTTIGQPLYKQACVPTVTHRSILAQYNRHVSTYEGSNQSHNFYNWNADFGTNIWHSAATIVSILSVAVHTSSAAPREKTKLRIVKNLSTAILTFSYYACNGWSKLICISQNRDKFALKHE